MNFLRWLTLISLVCVTTCFYTSSIYASPPSPTAGCPGHDEYFNSLEFTGNTDAAQIQLVICGNNNISLDQGYKTPSDWDVEGVWSKCIDDSSKICAYKLSEGKRSPWIVTKEANNPRGFFTLSGSANCDPFDGCGWKSENSYTSKKWGVPPGGVNYTLLRQNIIHNYPVYIHSNQPNDDPQKYYNDCNELDYNGVTLFDGDKCKGDFRAYNTLVNAPVETGFIPDSMYVGSGWSAAIQDGNGHAMCVVRNLWDLDVDYFPGTNIKLQWNIKNIQTFHNSNCDGRDQNQDGAVDPQSLTLAIPVNPSNSLPPADQGSSGEKIIFYGSQNYAEQVGQYVQGNWDVLQRTYFSFKLPENWNVTLHASDGRSRCFSDSVPNLQDHESWWNEIDWINVEDSPNCPQSAPEPSCYKVSPTFLYDPSDGGKFELMDISRWFFEGNW